MSNNINTINNKILPKIQLLHQKWMKPVDLAESYKRFIESKSQALYDVYSDITTILDRLSLHDPQYLINAIMDSFYPGADKPQVSNAIGILKYQAWNYGDYDNFPTLPQVIVDAMEGCRFITAETPFKKWYCPIAMPNDTEGRSTTPFYCIDAVFSSIFQWYYNEYMWDGVTTLYDVTIPTKAANGYNNSLTPAHLLSVLEEQTLKNQTIISALDTIISNRSAADFLLILKAAIGDSFEKVANYAQSIIQTLQNNVKDLYQAIVSIISPIGNNEFVDNDVNDPTLRLQVQELSTDEDVVGLYWVGKAESFLSASFNLVASTIKFVVKASWSLVKSAVKLVWNVALGAGRFLAAPPTLDYNDKGDGSFNVFSSNVLAKFINMHQNTISYPGWGDSLSDVVSQNFGITATQADIVKAIFGDNYEEMIEIPFTFGSIYLECTAEGVHMCVRLRPSAPSVQDSGIRYPLEFLRGGSTYEQLCSLDTQFERLFNSPVVDQSFTKDDEFYMYEGIQWSRARMEFFLGMITAADLTEQAWSGNIPMSYYNNFGYRTIYDGKSIHVGPISPRGYNGSDINTNQWALHDLDFVPTVGWDTNDIFYGALVYNNTMRAVSECQGGTFAYTYNQPAFNIVPHLLAFMFYNTKLGIQLASEQTASTPNFFVPYRQVTSMGTPSWTLIDDATQAQIYNNRMVTTATIAIVVVTAAVALKSISAARTSKIMAVDLASRQYTAIAMRGGDTTEAALKYKEALASQRRFAMIFGGAVGSTSSSVVSGLSDKVDLDPVISLIR